MTSTAREAAIRRRQQLSGSGSSATSSRASPRPTSGGAAAGGTATRTIEATGRAIARARRRAASTTGKRALSGTEHNRQSQLATASTTLETDTETPSSGGCGCGCKRDGEQQAAKAPSPNEVSTQGRPASRRHHLSDRAMLPTGRLQALARRRAQSAHGKTASPTGGAFPPPTLRDIHPDLSGRDLARQVRQQRSRNGGTGERSSAPCGRTRERNEPTSASTEFPSKVGVSDTAHGPSVTGSLLGRGARVTGTDVGACRSVTGTEYLGAEELESFCGTEPPRGPVKGGSSRTSRGGLVTGTLVGRSVRVTGDEPGSCRHVTGNEYLGSEEFERFCQTSPPPTPAKAGLSATFGGKRVSGSQTSRSSRVTGNEPGSCKAVTGTAYASADQYADFCSSTTQAEAMARRRQMRSTPGPDLTGQQPGLDGRVTGAEQGACEPVTGTPYVGSAQYAASCGPALPGAPDFPRSLDGAPWAAFSVTSPARAAQQLRSGGAITGTRYEEGHITGPFGMGTGKVTGTEQFRFGEPEQQVAAATPPPAETAASVSGRAKPRITGEGMDEGLRITGDDWDRGDRVTGTEGHSSTRRNPTRRGGPMSAMSAVGLSKQEHDVSRPECRVTGSSGATERGALVTVSGGARG